MLVDLYRATCAAAFNPSGSRNHAIRRLPACDWRGMSSSGDLLFF
jgi:hypothetical protein